MSIFPESGSVSLPSAITVDVPSIVVYRSRVTAGGPDLDPTFGSWSNEPMLKVEGIFRGSSFAGMSYAKLSLAPGRPAATDDTRIEDLDVMQIGDRVAIALGIAGRVLFAGYCTQAGIVIEKDGEHLSFHISGPEWLWGDSPAGGADRPVRGQVRRVATADDTWAGSPDDTTSGFGDLRNFTADQTIFNPDGHRNMTTEDVALIDGGDDANNGRCFETNDRRLGTAMRAALWTQKDAAKYLVSSFNSVDRTGIEDPDFSSVVIEDDKPLRSVNVEGMGLWSALKAVLAPEYGFYVIPIPSSISGSDWGGFQLKFFKRTSGDEADVRLSTLGTAMTDSDFAASVARLEASKDIRETVTQVTVIGARVRQLRLRYFGGYTLDATDDEKKIMLQHGWTSTDADIGDYGEIRQELPSAKKHAVVDVASITAKGAAADDWRDKYCTSGTKFAANQHVFRLFVWNESGEWGGDGADAPTYNTTATDGSGVESITNTDYDYQKPDLTDITDGVDPDGTYARRRHPALDTLYLIPGSDAWQRVPPTLYISDDIEETPWVRVPTSAYRLDRDRMAVWIMIEDIARWFPLFKLPQYVKPPEDDGGGGPPDDAAKKSKGGLVVPDTVATPSEGDMDGRSFATLLYTGNLRLMLECSIDEDWALEEKSPRTDDAGSPFIRAMTYRREQDFILSEEYDDGIDSPSGLTASLVDTSSEAQTLSDQMRDSAQDQQTHASVLVEADWPGQAIGTFIVATGGRVVNLQGGPSSNGALIVAQFLDCVAMKWELLTEQAALHLRSRDRRHHRRRFNRGRFGVPGVPQAG